MITRRGFLLSCLALGAAPAIVRASSIMRVRSMPAVFDIDRLVAYMRDNHVKPAIIGGQECYVMMTHPDYSADIMAALKAKSRKIRRARAPMRGSIYHLDGIRIIA